MKKFLLACSVLLLAFFIGRYVMYSTNFVFPSIFDKKPETFVKTEGKDILVREGDTWNVLNIRGVNLGAGKPAKYATEFDISYKSYMRWFKMMQDMNANVIRVYTIQNTDFYHAFYDYNKKAKKPIYLIHGVWVDDYAMRSHLDAFSDEMRGALLNDVKTIVDVIHGKRKISFNAQYAYGTYKWDVSKYVLGYIIGVEWESDLVLYTNDKRNSIAEYDGKYMYTSKDASPFECMLAEVGDSMFDYEMKKYHQQRLVAFSNWPETDPLNHEKWRAHHSANLAKLDVEHIKLKDTVKSGTFASYHVYPYYPLFYEFEERYANYMDEDGVNNPYRGYLKDLNDHHSMPVVIAEFGIPASRGIARYDNARGYDQGHVTETEQGEYLQALYEDIRKAGCSGGIMFEWHDEWFKKTWNTWPGVDLTRNVFWSDYQTNEQSFGLLTFDPGSKSSVCYIDGVYQDWKDIKPIVETKSAQLSMQYDEKFVYFRIHSNSLNMKEETFYIPLDITPKSGAEYCEDENLDFDTPADFLIKIQGKKNSWIKVQEYYDMVYANFRRDVWNEDAFLNKPKKNSAKFNTIYQYLRGPIILNDEGDKTEAEIYDTGKLAYGNANPKSSEYNSLADYMIADHDIEIRIPWGLLNFSDPSEMVVHDDYYKHYGVINLSIDTIKLALQNTAPRGMDRANSAEVEMKGWGEDPSYHERLKKSYHYVKELYASYAKEDEDARNDRK